MKKIFTLFVSLLAAASLMAQGWPAQYKGVMLQGFYWDSFADTQWTNLESQADELAEFFDLIWIPQSGKSGSYPNKSMGYDDLWWFTDYTSSFGNEAQLRSMIKTFKSKGLGTIADVVINHRSTLAGTWMQFPVETYNGKTYTMSAADVCSNDDAASPDNPEEEPTGAPDSGDGFDGARDLDHSSVNVQTVVKAYLDFLLNDLGYAGFRYDMVKGYAPKYTAIYNASAQPQYSVGEYWDGNASNVEAWIDGTKSDGIIQSAAFDFPLKYYLRDCCNANSGWNRQIDNSLMFSPKYRRYAVTFVDNHDTYGRGNDSEITKNVLAANAFILAMPGTPCVFLPHWKAYKQAIKQMIYARKAVGISNMSTFKGLNNTTAQYAAQVNGDAGASVVVLMGSTEWPSSTAEEADYFLVQTGDNFAYYLSRSAETAWASVPSGTYDNAITVTLNAVTAQDGVQIVYTTDGTEPSAANGTKVNDGAQITVSTGCTLKAGLLSGGTVSGIITRNYTIKAFQPHDITVYVNADAVGWQQMYYHTWGGDGSHGTNWPGKLVTATKEVGGKTWYYNTYRLNSSGDYVSFVFDAGSNANQTVNVENVTTDKYYEISTQTSGSHHLVYDVTADYSTGISSVTVSNGEAVGRPGVYTIDGRLVRMTERGTSASEAVSGLPRGLYIVNGRKMVVR